MLSLVEFALALDFEEMHRLVAFGRRTGPSKQAEPGGDLILNCRGMFGVSSAAYWWGCLGSALLRMLYLFLGRLLGSWLLLFADDWGITSGGSDFVERLLSTAWPRHLQRAHQLDQGQGGLA